MKAVYLCVSVLPALLDCVSPQQRVNNRVNRFLKVLNEHSVACHDSLFNNIHITGTKVNR